MPIKKEELIRNYVKAIREGNAAVFAGSGLSRSSGYVDWKELIRPLAKDIELDVDKETDMLSVAQFYRNKKRTRGAINQEILNAFSKDVQINENIQILSRLPIFTYWTTNYDRLLEEGIRSANRKPDVKFETEQIPNMIRDRDAIVYKMHGDVEHPAKAVLTKEDYELYEYHRPLFRTALKGDLISKVFLFIGFSFSDPNLDYVLSQIRSLLGENIPNHYCFVKRVQESDFSDKTEYGYCLAKQDLQEENLRNYGIQTVFVDSYDEITDILRDIERASKFKNVFISGSSSKYIEPWDKNKAEKLAGNIAGALVRKDCRIVSGFGLGIGSAVINGALDVIYKEKYRHLDEHLRLYPFPQNISEPNEREEKWKEYREKIIEDTGVAIFIFGNKIEEGSDTKIIADGCIEEFEIAKKKGNIIIPIGSTGDAAKKIFDEVKIRIQDYLYLDKFINKLESETDIDKIVDLILRILEDIEK
ncbi:SIR2 family protein [Peptostreptococcus sp.]